MKRYNVKEINTVTCSKIALIILIFYAVIGLICFDDYGCGPDEGMERQTALVNYKYVLNKLHLPVSEQNRTWMEYLPELKEYRDRYYGTALHFPLVLIESTFHFTMEPSEFYGMRHFYTFLNYFISVVCFYKLLSKRFNKNIYGICGMLMMIISPRFFAESFYNNKDVIFVAWYVICIYLMDKWFRNRNLKNTVFLSLSLALTINTRFNGIIFIPVFVFLYIFDSIRKGKNDSVKLFLLTLILTLVFFYLITPNFWDNPIQTLIETLRFNMRHPNHGSDGNLFNGHLVDAARTWEYIPVWISITIPFVYLLFSVLGTITYISKQFHLIYKREFMEINMIDAAVFISGFIAVAFIIITHVTIYNGWRHCYFTYPCIIYFAVYFLYKISVNWNKKVLSFVYVIFILSVLYNAGWIVVNHPYEYVYFSMPGKNHANEFSGDYWGISSRALFEFITKTDPKKMLLINHANTQAGSINRGLLPQSERQYIELTYDDSPDIDYYIVCRDDKRSTDLNDPLFEKVYSISVDNDEIGAVYKNREK